MTGWDNKARRMERLTIDACMVTPPDIWNFIKYPGICTQGRPQSPNLMLMLQFIEYKYLNYAPDFPAGAIDMKRPDAQRNAGTR
jgi:hypothetical protein